MEYKTIVISDLHLGTKHNLVKKVNSFLKENNSELIILNGDIIDGWKLKRRFDWNYSETKFINRILKKTKTTKVIYIKGNHDEFLLNFIPFKMKNFEIVKDFKYKAINGRNYYICHGDIFDFITSNVKIVSILGDIIYSFLTVTNKPFNKIRKIFGKEYLSISKIAKNIIKKFYLNDGFHNKIQKYCIKKGCDGIILGHTHIAEISNIDDFHYMNSGDCIENGTMLVENLNGEWNILNL